MSNKQKRIADITTIVEAYNELIRKGLRTSFSSMNPKNKGKEEELATEIQKYHDNAQAEFDKLDDIEELHWNFMEIIEKIVIIENGETITLNFDEEKEEKEVNA